MNNVNPVSYQLYNPPNSEDQCGICFDPFGEQAVVAHSEGGEKHPIHARCLRIWFRYCEALVAGCPSCRKPVDLTSLYQPLTLKERVASCTLDILTHPYSIGIQGVAAALFLGGVSYSIGLQRPIGIVDFGLLGLQCIIPSTVRRITYWALKNGWAEVCGGAENLNLITNREDIYYKADFSPATRFVLLLGEDKLMQTAKLSKVIGLMEEITSSYWFEVWPLIYLNVCYFSDREPV